MSAQITRTITTWNASAYRIAWVDGQPTADLIGQVDYMGSDSKTEARAALKEAGYDCPRGTEVVITKVSEQLYAMPVETFLKHARKVEQINA